MKIKVITEYQNDEFEKLVNDFLEEKHKILDIQFSTAHFSEDEIAYTAFIRYQ